MHFNISLNIASSWLLYSRELNKSGGKLARKIREITWCWDLMHITERSQKDRKGDRSSEVVSLIDVDIKGDNKKLTVSLDSLQLVLKTSRTEEICLL